MSAREIRNSKPETEGSLNKLKTQMGNDQNRPLSTAGLLWRPLRGDVSVILTFDILICFVFRTSCFEFRRYCGIITTVVWKLYGHAHPLAASGMRTSPPAAMMLM